MAYTINRTDGTLLVELIDGILDVDTTDISLVGRNYTGFGEAVNENFIKLLENFANTNQPAAPLTGQLWYDKSENKLKVFDGETFQSAAGSFISETFPTGPIPGDTWFSTIDKQFYLFTGTDWQLIGPAYTSSQGTSGIVVDSIDDLNLTPITVLKLVINESLVAVLSNIEFIPNQLPTNIVQGLVTESNPTGTIYKGWNVLDKTGFIYRGTAENAQNLLSVTGTPIPESVLVKTNQQNTVSDLFTIANSSGLVIGESGQGRFVVDDGVSIRSTAQGFDFNIDVNSSADPVARTTAIKVKANTKRVGIFQSNPQYNLDVTGSARITGDLIVEGDQVTTNVTTLDVEDKNIELGSVAGPTDNTADGGGITLKGSTDKTINWYTSTDSWTSSEHFDLVPGREYRIENTQVLSATTLGNGVTNSNLENLGTLTSLTVNTTRLVNNILTRTGGLTGFQINVGGDINVTSSKIVNMTEPTDDYDAANKIYVDRTIQTEPIIFSMDLTGYVSGEYNDRLIDYLNDLYPPSVFAEGKKARVACYYYGNQSTDPIDVATNSSTTTVEVNAAAGGTVSVLQGINLPNSLTPTFTLSITRETRYFIVNNLGNWIVNSDTNNL
ncbi:MAG: hypothetical protein VW551_00295 [Euryarchaeota archaeon]|jgi:hypothetical protein